MKIIKESKRTNNIISIDILRDNMQCNGYAYFDDDAFLKHPKKVCYIPENAETIEDCFSYLDLRKEVNDWLNFNPEYLKEHETTVDDLLINMYENITWEFPSTYLAGLDY